MVRTFLGNKCEEVGLRHISAEAPLIFAEKMNFDTTMTEVIDRIPQLENRIYIIGGPGEQALSEAMSLILGFTDKHYISTEFYCLKNTEEDIRTRFEDAAAKTGLGMGARRYFRTQRNGDVDVVNRKIWASHDRRFVRLVFIDSLESMHLKGQAHDREGVLRNLTTYNPVIVVSDELSPAGADGGRYESGGALLSLTVSG